MTELQRPQTPAHGLLARRYCDKCLPVQVLQSRGGYYLGTCDQDGPVSRESEEYFLTADQAHAVHRSHAWTQRMEP